MRNTILFTAFFLSLCAILITWQSESPNEQLAYRMSKSESFKEIMNAGKRMANHVTHWPDSTKNKMRQFKPRVDLILRNPNLTFIQKRDSLEQLAKFVSNTDTGMIGEAKEMLPVYKRFNREFPEFKSMSREERIAVFKKATRMLIKNSKV